MSFERRWVGMSESTNYTAIIRSQKQKLDEDDGTSVTTTDSSFTATEIGSLPLLNQAIAQTNPITNHTEPIQQGYSQLNSYIAKEEATTTATNSSTLFCDHSTLTKNSISSEILHLSEIRQHVNINQDHQEVDHSYELNFVLNNSEPRQTNTTNTANTNSSESKPSETTYSKKKSAETSVGEKIKLLQRQIDEATALSANHRLHLEQPQENNETTLNRSEKSNVYSKDKLGYQLRALREDISALESNPWVQAPTLPNILKTSTLSSELVNETLNYFVNCGQRLSQMTKTYDDNDAYMLLLQEKEVDLELAARIGQDLLKQNKELKDSIKSLQDELTKRQDDVHQLKHDLASKTSLLETFIVEEEERNNSHNDTSEGVSTYRHQDYFSDKLSTSTDQNKNSTPSIPIHNLDHEEDDCYNGFSSLNIQTPKPSTSVEPFSSLSYHINHTSSADLKPTQHLPRDDSANSICDDFNSRPPDHNGLVQTVTFQLVESNKRLCELQDEISFKGEQNILQQEKIFQLQEQIRESDRRIGDIAIENESLQRSMAETVESRKELCEELKVCKTNFNELLKVFLELQKESRLYRMRNESNNWNLNYLGEVEQLNEMNNVSFDSFHNSASYETLAANNNHHNLTKGTYNGCNNLPMSSSLLDELQESVRRKRRKDQTDDSSDGGATDEGDSGVHTHKTISGSKSKSKSTSATPTIATTTHSAGTNLLTDIESDESGADDQVAAAVAEKATGGGDAEGGENKRSWLGFSSFMLTTLLLLCLSVTVSSSSNLKLAAHRLQIKLDR